MLITLAMIATLAMPPKEYDHPPAYKVEVMDFPAELIEAVCHTKAPEGGMLLGCWNGKKIYIRDDLTEKARAKVLRHEYGHVNGWVHPKINN